MVERLVFCLLFLLALCSAAPADEEITSLPNLTEPLRSKHYTGYLDVSVDKKLFYWYVESEQDPANDPLVLWLNGGPGCASMEGLFIEMGPFRVRNYGEQVDRNPWTWNRIANIIYLDAPAGVGYSYYNSTHKQFTDDEVAQDNFDALKLWFEKFPERKTNEFFVAGESYGGTYVPMISAKLTNNADVFPNFKGMLVGNGCVDDKINFNTNIMYQYYHGVVDETQMQTVISQCCSGSPDCDFYTLSNQNNTCADLINDLSYSIYYSGYDPYFLYFACYVNPNLPYPPEEEIQRPQQLVLRNHLAKKIGGISQSKGIPIIPSNAIHGQPDCASHSDHFPYLNTPEVRKILRIPDYVQTYEMCNMEVAELYESQYENMKQFFDTVIGAEKRVAMFNGDADSLCNYVENSQFLYKTLNLTLKTKMTAWNDPVQLPRAVGQITEYQGVTLVSIKGGGHFPAATEQKPKEAFQMFQNYVKNQNYSTAVEFDKPYSGNGTTTLAPIDGNTSVGTNVPSSTPVPSDSKTSTTSSSNSQSTNVPNKDNTSTTSSSNSQNTKDPSNDSKSSTTPVPSTTTVPTTTSPTTATLKMSSILVTITLYTIYA